MSDYIEAIRHFVKKRFFHLGQIIIDNDDFTNIFKFYQKKESLENVSLFYNFTKRFREKGSSHITFIVNHENMVSEKALILGVKDYLKDLILLVTKKIKNYESTIVLLRKTMRKKYLIHYINIQSSFYQLYLRMKMDGKII